MGKWQIVFFPLAFLFALGLLNRSPRARRHPLVRRLNLVIDLLFWILLLVYSGFFLCWLLASI